MNSNIDSDDIDNDDINDDEENYDIIVKPDEKGFCDYKIFSSIIIMSSIKISHRLDVYKELHGEAKEVLCSSIQDMFDFINEANNKSQNIPYFLKNFLLNQVINQIINSMNMTNIGTKS